MDVKSAAANNPTAESGPRNTTSDAGPQQKPEQPRMIGDFDGSASEFWKHFKDEAKSHDDARIYSLKEDMEFLKFPYNYLPLPHKFPSLPLHQPLSPHSAL